MYFDLRRFSTVICIGVAVIWPGLGLVYGKVKNAFGTKTNVEPNDDRFIPLSVFSLER